jgi:hypothetical protein
VGSIEGGEVLDDDFGAAWLVIALGFILFVTWKTDTMLGRAEFAFLNKVPYSDLVMAKRPYDCDFWTAPVGQKHCSYEPIVTPYQAAGRRHIYVAWDKVAD